MRLDRGGTPGSLDRTKIQNLLSFGSSFLDCYTQNLNFIYYNPINYYLHLQEHYLNLLKVEVRV